MRGLTIVVASADQTRLRSALGLALSHVALAGAARLFLDTAAVTLLRRPIVGSDDAAQSAAGMPTLAALVGEALETGVTIILCQAGMAMIDATVSDFDGRIGVGGMIGVLAAIEDDRLVTV